MHAAPDMTEKRAFQMNAERPGSRATKAAIPRYVLNRIRQPVEGGAGLVKRSGHGRRQITGDAVFEKQLLNGAYSGGIRVHHILPRTSVNVNVHEARGQDGIAKI